MTIGTVNVNNLPFWYQVCTILYLTAIALYDIRHHKIKNLALFFFLIWCLISLPLGFSGEWNPIFSRIPESLLGFFLGAFLFLIISYIPGCHMGGGDIKLAALLGILAGPEGILTISFTSAAYALLYLQLRCKTSQPSIPFAPFFLLGTITLFILWRYS
ncbi:MAG: prepilin peptidase [Lachnospiraceae bacterium]|nr:prepilin peptidase [Lachnospiraceae bacterium]